MNTLIAVCVYILGVTLTSSLLKSDNETSGDKSTRDMLSVFWPLTLIILIIAWVFELIDYIKNNMK